MTTNRTYKFDRIWTLFACLLVVSAIPFLDVYELITTGSIDWSAMSKGRIKFPVWMASAFGWPVFFWFLLIFFNPFVKYLKWRYIFRIEGDILYIEDVSIPKSDVISYSHSLFSGTVIVTKSGEYSCYPGLSYGGYEGIEEFLESAEFV